MENASNNEWREDLLRRYLANQCTQQEREHVEKWYAAIESSPSVGNNLERESLKKIRKNVLASIHVPSAGYRFIQSLHPFIRVAAAVVIVLGTAILSFQIYFRSQIYDEAFLTQKGEQKTIVLPDSSIVRLNAGSKIRVYYNLRARQRMVTLEGEASFQVAKNPESPFKVTADRITTQVLGTTFNVQAYGNDHSVTVTVAEGKVAVAGQNSQGEFDKLTEGLLPDQQLVYNRQTKNTFFRNVDAQKILEWREGVLSFENAPLSEIAIKLERKYGVDIRVTGQASSDCRYTFAVRDEPIAKALQILEKVSGTQIVKNNSNQLIFNTSSCK
jgi:transmembrane sensor